MVCLKVAHVDTARGRYTVALFVAGIDYEVNVRDPRRRWTVLGRFDPEQRDGAHALYASTVAELTPAL
jgi:hypothetical protein